MSRSPVLLVISAHAAGRAEAEAAGAVLGAPPVFRFEPHQPEMCEFTPDVLVDIPAVFDTKLAAMREMGSHERVFPQVAEVLS